MVAFPLRSCQVRLGFSCFALLSFCCLFLGADGSAFFLAAAACHEAAHVAMLFWLKAPPATVQVTALGCRIIPNREKLLSYRQMAAVSLAGPGMNWLLAGALALLGQGESYFAGANLVLGVLHSLPIEPLDGGMALHSLLCVRMKASTAARVSTALSAACLLPLAALGFAILLRTRYNFTLLAMSLYLMLYLVLKRDFFMG